MGKKITKKLAPGIYQTDSGAFRVKVSVGDRKRGGRTCETTFPKGTSLRKMKAWQDEQRAAIRRQRLVPATGTLEADIPRYLDEKLAHLPKLAKHRNYLLKSWLTVFGARRRHTISSDEVQEQVEKWSQEGIAASTIRHRLTALSKLCEALDGKKGSNPVKDVARPTEPDAQPDWRSPDVIQRVLDCLWYRTAMNNRGWKTLARALVLTHTGMRPSQLMRLDPEIDIRPHLSANQPFVQVRIPGKGGRAHLKPLTADGISAFGIFLLVRAEGEFSTSAFYKSWKLACKEAGVTPFRPYLLRHSYATLLRRGGADIADVQELLGHRSPKTTQRYATVVPEKLATAVQQMEQVWKDSRGLRAWTGPETAEKKAASDK